MASAVPEEYGGLGGEIMEDVIITEEFARGSLSVAMGYGTTTVFGARSILFSGTEEFDFESFRKLGEFGILGLNIQK